MTSAEEGSRRHKNKSISSSSFSSSIIEMIRQSHPHDHDVMIYPDLPTFRQVYSQATKEALERNEIVFLTTTYDSFQRVIDSLKQGRISVNKEVKHGNLIILDAVKAYQIDISGVLNFAKSLLMRAAKNGKAGVFNISDMGSFFLADRIPILVEYERSLRKKMDIELKAVCSYHKGDFENLSKEQQQAILSAHKRIISA
ncbi:MAG TPA: MEDS domain-containing protein [Nitrososphaeraceae archaeon]|nr:MEDS domain-containing protein [Nitrososphaeraceae archaeon]